VVEIVVRTLVQHVAETRRDGGRDLERPHRVALVAAVIENPYPTDRCVLLEHTLDARTRSHHQTFTFQIADAPRPREIVVACVAANRGRPLARLATFGTEISR
jgi:Amino acid synthesis